MLTYAHTPAAPPQEGVRAAGREEQGMEGGEERAVGGGRTGMEYDLLEGWLGLGGREGGNVGGGGADEREVLSLSLSLSLCLCLCAPVTVTVSVCLSLCLSVCQSVSPRCQILSLSLSLYLSLFLPLSPSLSLSLSRSLTLSLFPPSSSASAADGPTVGAAVE